MGKKRARIILITILLVIIIAVAFIIFLVLNASPAGVRVGDEFVYDIKGYGVANDPNATIPEAFSQLNMTEYYKVIVTDVSGPEVSINTTWLFTNGTELKGTGTVDVETGMYYPTGGFYAVYAANLRENDRLRPIGPDRATINATANRNYAGGVRETNRVSLVLQYYDSEDPTYTRTLTEYMNVHFDRQTGMLVELRDMSVYTNPYLTLTVVWTIKETNVWAIS